MTSIEEKQSFIQVDKAKLFCRIFGEGSPLIVIPGGPGLGQNYLLPQMSEIGKFSFAIFYDQRGTGKSIDPDNAWQSQPFQTYVRDINQLREAFGFKTVSLLAHSWGGILASLYALAHPHHVDKIIYLNSVPVSSKDYVEFVKHRSQIVDSHKAELDLLRKSSAFAAGDPETIEKFYRIYFKKYFAKPKLEKNLTLKMNPQAAINNFKIYDLFYNHLINHPFDLYEKLHTLNKKSLIIAADKDVIPLSYAEHLHRSISSSEFILIKESGHFPYIDQPKILFKILQMFLAK